MNTDPNKKNREQMEIRIVALLLGESSPFETAEIQAAMQKDPQLAAFHDEMRRTIDLVGDASKISAQADAAGQPKLSPERRENLFAQFREKKVIRFPYIEPLRKYKRWLVPVSLAAGFLIFAGMLGSLMLPALAKAKAKAQRIDLIAKLKLAEIENRLASEEGAEASKGQVEGERLTAHYDVSLQKPTPIAGISVEPGQASTSAKQVEVTTSVNDADAGLIAGETLKRGQQVARLTVGKEAYKHDNVEVGGPDVAGLSGERFPRQEKAAGRFSFQVGATRQYSPAARQEARPYPMGMMYTDSQPLPGNVGTVTAGTYVQSQPAPAPQIILPDGESEARQKAAIKRHILFSSPQAPEGNAIEMEQQAFFRAIESGAPPPVTGEQGLAALCLAAHILSKIGASEIPTGRD